MGPNCMLRPLAGGKSLKLQAMPAKYQQKSLCDLWMGYTFSGRVNLAFAVKHGKHALHGALGFGQVREGQLCLAAWGNLRFRHTHHQCELCL